MQHPGPGCALESGIDHEAFRKQIIEYKRRKEKGHGVGAQQGWGPERVAELTKQMRKRRKAKPRE